MATVGQTVSAPVKSPYTSKVNWIAGVGGVLTTLSAYAALASHAAPMIPAPYGLYVTMGAAFVTGLATIWARTFNTTSVLAPSAATSAATG